MSRTAHSPVAGDGTIVGPVRVEPTVTALVRRLRKGDVAVIDVMDLDQRTAEDLASHRPAAVVNARPSISGRYPAGGPRVLLDAGIPLIDAAGPAVLDLHDGTTVSITGGAISVDGQQVAHGTVLDADAIVDAMRGAADGMRVQAPDVHRQRHGDGDARGRRAARRAGPASGGRAAHGASCGRGGAGLPASRTVARDPSLPA
ncbi:hypothetical protein [Demequina litorisediminis]|uniref:hypothetical protein n=1 Tax=Demequina litorisediminis TaxID=1849022 RepID=UPI0024E13AEA|nr:hypothetical protein [Demequina litorisediminis]